MYQLYYTERNSTLYERNIESNTGLDPILELTKIASGSSLNGFIQADTYNSRILLDIGNNNISDLSQSIVDNKIPPLGNSSNSASVYLTMTAADASDLTLTYNLKAYAVSESWSAGQGTVADIPITKIGVSWEYRDAVDPGTKWNTGSAASSGDASATNPGGGTWITGSGFEASQSFSNQLPHIRMNVTDIMSKWIDGSVTNNGLILKRDTVDENSGAILGSIKFYGRDTNTIFIPRLEVSWDDSIQSGTGSYSEIDSETYVPYFKNIRRNYYEADNSVFRIGVRPEYPTKTYQTGSWYLPKDRLPTSSYYSVKDAVTEETIIPFDTSATRISCDMKGSFFKLRLNTFMPERYYKILLKVEREGGDDIQIHDNGYYFKVER